MKRHIVRVAIVLAAAAASPREARSDIVDWADKFLTSHTRCYNNGCDLQHFYDSGASGGNGHNRRWDYVGLQTVDGRFNAVERSSFSVVDENNNCMNVTSNLARWRAPASQPGNTCSFTGASFVGSVSYTHTGCNYPLNDRFYSNRNLPEMDFALEPGTGQNASWVGYVSRSTLSGSGMSMRPASGSVTGCYQILWFP